MYEDSLACILRPGVQKGIIVWTDFTEQTRIDSLCDLGLKTEKKTSR